MRRGVWQLARLALLLLSLVVPDRGATADEGGRLPSGLGVHVQVWHIGLADLERIRNFGFSFVRWGISWQAVEKSPGNYDWASVDAFVEDLRRAGLPSIAILATGNSLYSRSLDLPSHPSVREMKVPAPPETEAAVIAFSRFAAAAARRYADHSVTWEIWNEPDSPIFWPPEPRPDAYAQLASAACQAIKAAAPQSKVLGPTTAALPIAVPAFYKVLAASGAAQCLDGLSMHSYRMQNGVQPDPESVYLYNINSRALISSLSPMWREIPLLSTEWGYPSSAVGPTTQVAYLARTYLTNLTSGMRATVWYEWKDSRNEPWNPESHFGLQTRQSAFKIEPNDMMIRRLVRMQFVRRLETKDPNIQAILFKEGSADQVVAWIRSADPTQTTQVIISGKSVSLGSIPTIVAGDQIQVRGYSDAQ